MYIVMKSTKTLLLTCFYLLILTASCTTESTESTSINEGVKSNNEILDLNNTDSNLINNHTEEEENVILDKDVIEISNEIFDLVNSYRNSIGLNSLVNNNTAKIESIIHSENQGDENTISHNSSASRAQIIFNYENASSYGENVAFGYTTPEKLIEAWINSEPHRLNIEGDFENTGIGTIVNDRGVLYFTQIFFK